MARAEYGLIDDPVIAKIAEKHKRSPGQICLRWNAQQGFIVLPKSVTPARIAENMNIFDFELSEEEMNEISALTKLGKMKAYEKMNCE